MKVKNNIVIFEATYRALTAKTQNEFYHHVDVDIV